MDRNKQQIRPLAVILIVNLRIESFIYGCELQRDADLEESDSFDRFRVRETAGISYKRL